MEDTKKTQLFEQTAIPKAVMALAIPVSYTHLTLPTTSRV